jgi:amidase
MKQTEQNTETRQGISRRAFLGAGAMGAAALLTGGVSSLARRAGAAPGDGMTVSWSKAGGRHGQSWFEASIPQLQSLMAKGKLTSRELTQNYLKQIEELNPLLHAVIETNPEALAIAARLDEERRKGRLRGPLHGIPVMVKDNIATFDRMETTAGSLALVGSKVRADAPIVSRMREAGAVILGKTNLSEWANFRGIAPFNGWSARGGFTRNPYVLNWDTCGSSSGSGVAPAANLCAAAVGSETDGSVVCPAGNNLIVGIKPTIGLLPGAGIIPIAHSQDTAGPMTRTVTDAAILLGVMAGVPAGYTARMKPGSLRKARIGIDRRLFTAEYGADPAIVAQAEKAIEMMRRLGAVVVDTDTGDPLAYGNEELAVLTYEMKVDMANYLAGVDNTEMRTLADLIQFNKDHCPEEMKYFGQEWFEASEQTSGLDDPVYKEARAKCLRLARDEGIDAALERDQLDAIVAPSYSWGSTAPAVAGYPNLALPVGLCEDGRPAGIEIYGGAYQEQKLIAYAYDLEQALKPRSDPPAYLGAVPPEPADAGICAAGPAAKRVAPMDREQLIYHLGTSRRMCRCF